VEFVRSDKVCVSLTWDISGYKLLCWQYLWETGIFPGNLYKGWFSWSFCGAGGLLLSPFNPSLCQSSAVSQNDLCPLEEKDGKWESENWSRENDVDRKIRSFRSNLESRKTTFHSCSEWVTTSPKPTDWYVHRNNSS